MHCLPLVAVVGYLLIGCGVTEVATTVPDPSEPAPRSTLDGRETEGLACPNVGANGPHSRRIEGAHRACDTDADCRSVQVDCSYLRCTAVHGLHADAYGEPLDCQGYRGEVGNYDCMPRFGSEGPACIQGCCESVRGRRGSPVHDEPTVEGVPVESIVYAPATPVVNHGRLTIRMGPDGPGNGPPNTAGIATAEIVAVDVATHRRRLRVDEFFVYALPDYVEVDPAHMNLGQASRSEFEVSFAGRPVPPADSPVVEIEVRAGGRTYLARSPVTLVVRTRRHPRRSDDTR